MADIRDRDGNLIDEVTVGIQRISPTSGMKLYKPDVPLSYKPADDMVFQSIEHAFDFYESYARIGGFSVRKGSHYVNGKILKLKHFVCSKEGHRPCKEFNSLYNTDTCGKRIKGRNRPTIRTGCQAHIGLKSEDGIIFKVFKFVEEHNHSLVSQEDIHMLSAYRKLTYEQMLLMCAMSKHNIGPVRAFNIMRTKYGGFENVGVTVNDCKNFKKELNLHIGEYDADIVVNMLLSKKEFHPDFSFEYTKDSKGQLTNWVVLG